MSSKISAFGASSEIKPNQEITTRKILETIYKELPQLNKVRESLGLEPATEMWSEDEEEKVSVVPILNDQTVDNLDVPEELKAGIKLLTCMDYEAYDELGRTYIITKLNLAATKALVHLVEYMVNEIKGKKTPTSGLKWCTFVNTFGLVSFLDEESSKTFILPVYLPIMNYLENKEIAALTSTPVTSIRIHMDQEGERIVKNYGKPGTLATICKNKKPVILEI